MCKTNIEFVYTSQISLNFIHMNLLCKSCEFHIIVLIWSITDEPIYGDNFGGCSSTNLHLLCISTLISYHYNHRRPFRGSKHVDPANMASVQAAEMSVTGLFACPGSSPAQGHDTQGLVCGVAEVLPTNKLAHQGGHRYAKWLSLCRTTRGTPMTVRS